MTTTQRITKNIIYSCLGIIIGLSVYLRGINKAHYDKTNIWSLPVANAAGDACEVNCTQMSCNDGICNGNETCSSCPKDCGTCCVPKSKSEACGSQECGSASDGCGGSHSCGSGCSGDATCSNGSCCTDSSSDADVCGSKDCGYKSDSCGKRRSCGPSCSSSTGDGGDGGPVNECDTYTAPESCDGQCGNYPEKCGYPQLKCPCCHTTDNNGSCTIKSSKGTTISEMDDFSITCTPPMQGASVKIEGNSTSTYHVDKLKGRLGIHTFNCHYSHVSECKTTNGSCSIDIDVKRPCNNNDECADLNSETDPTENYICEDGLCQKRFCGDGKTTYAIGEECDDGKGDMKKVHTFHIFLKNLVKKTIEIDESTLPENRLEYHRSLMNIRSNNDNDFNYVLNYVLGDEIVETIMMIAYNEYLKSLTNLQPGKAVCDPNTCKYSFGSLECEEGSIRTNPLDVLFVLDRSTSMLRKGTLGGTNATNDCSDEVCKMNDAKYAISKFINSLDKEKDRVGLISFANCAQVDFALSGAGQGVVDCGEIDTQQLQYESCPYKGEACTIKDLETGFQGTHQNTQETTKITTEFFDILNKLEANGVTNAGAALELAYKHMIDNMRGDEVIPVVIFLSDGMPTIGRKNALYSHSAGNVHTQFAKEAADKYHEELEGRHIYTFALGYDIREGQDAEILMKDYIATIPSYYNNVGVNINKFLEEKYQIFCQCGEDKENCCGNGKKETYVDKDGETVTEECDRGTQNGKSSCSYTCEENGNKIDGDCGPTVIYDKDNGGDAYGSGAAIRCDYGDVTERKYNSEEHKRTWKCKGTPGAKTVSCFAKEERCGDNKVNSEKENCDNCPQDVPVCTCGDGKCYKSKCDKCPEDCDHKPVVCIEEPPTVICNQAQLIDPTTNKTLERGVSDDPNHPGTENRTCVEIPYPDDICGYIDSSNGRKIRTLNSYNNVETEIKCHTNGFNLAEEITIDCGNGQGRTFHNTTEARYTCIYDTFNGTNTRKYEAQCLFKEKGESRQQSASQDCKQDLIIRGDETPPYGICGDGYPDQREECDLGFLNNGDPLSELGGRRFANLPWSTVANANEYACFNCQLYKSPVTVVDPEDHEICYYNEQAANDANIVCEPQDTECFYQDAVISSMTDEYLPFRWDIDAENVVTTDTCEGPEDMWKIMRGSEMCEFVIMRQGSPSTDMKPLKYATFTRPCLINDRLDGNGKTKEMFIPFETHQKLEGGISLRPGRSYLEPSKVTEIFRAVDQNGNRIPLGEFKIKLASMKSLFCGPENQIMESQTDECCMSNFMMTDPYISQKGTFTTNQFTTNEFLSEHNAIDMQSMQANNQKKIFDEYPGMTYFELTEANQKALGTEIDILVQAFADKYQQLGQAVDNQFGPLENVAKVPSKEIYIVEEDVYLDNQDIKDFDGATLIVRNGNLTIREDFDSDGLFVVPDGKIDFITSEHSCKYGQSVGGIYLAGKGFTSTKQSENRNISTESKRCFDGGLDINGILIGEGIDSLIDGRRSQLNDRHLLHTDNKKQDGIYQGGAIYIENNAQIRTNPPDGLADLESILNVSLR